MEKNREHITTNDTSGEVYLPLYDFYIALKRNNFLVTPRQISDVNRIISHYADSVHSEIELCDYLAPVFVNSKEEQLQFRDIFKEYFAPNIIKAPEQREDSRIKKNRWAFISGLLVIVVGLIIFWPKNDPNELYDPQISLETILSDADSLKNSKQVELRLSSNDVYKKWSFKTEVDWGDNSSFDTILNHKYNKEGNYTITAYVKTRDENGVKYGDTTIQKTIGICFDKASITIQKDFPEDSIQIGQPFRLNAIINGKEPDSTSWSSLTHTNIDNNKTNELNTKVNVGGVQTFKFTAFYGDENSACNVQSEISFFVFDTSPIPEVIFLGDPSSDITFNNKVSWYWYLITGILVLLSFFSARKHYRQKRQKATAIYKIEHDYDEMIGSFSGKFGSKDIPFHNKNFLSLPESELSDVGRLMRKRISDDATYLHIDKTITKAINNAGFFDPVVAARTQQSEFLILIEQNNLNDQQAKLFEFLLDLLKKQHVYIDKYYYKSSPLHCYQEDVNIEVNLEKLSEKYPSHILLIFGNAYQLIYPDYPVIDQDCMRLLERWQYKAIMTPVSFIDWGNKEKKVLLQHLPIFPVDLQGQLLLMHKLFGEELNILSVLNQSRDDFYDAEMVDFEDMDELLDYCTLAEWANISGESKYSNILFQWIAALAVYPKITWELTLEIGKSILKRYNRESELNFTNLLRLARISWMKSGLLPDYMRINLLKQLSVENEIIARETILHAISEIPVNELNSSHFAFEERETQRIINEFNLYAYDPIKYAAYKNARALLAKLRKEGLITDVPAKTYFENLDLNWKTLINKQGQKGSLVKVPENISLNDYLDENPRKSSAKENTYIWANLLLFLVSLIGIIGLIFLDTSNKNLAPFTIKKDLNIDFFLFYSGLSEVQKTKNLIFSIDTTNINLIPDSVRARFPVLINDNAKRVVLNWNNKIIFDSIMEIKYEWYNLIINPDQEPTETLINPIYFDIDKWDIREDAKYELEKIVTVMRDNPNIAIEIETHTDSRGDDQYSMELTNRQAKSISDYLVSRNIASERISAIGYGETQLVNECSNGVKCSEEQHQANRRATFKIVNVPDANEITDIEIDGNQFQENIIIVDLPHKNDFSLEESRNRMARFLNVVDSMSNNSNIKPIIILDYPFSNSQAGLEQLTSSIFKLGKKGLEVYGGYEIPDINDITFEDWDYNQARQLYNNYFKGGRLHTVFEIIDNSVLSYNSYISIDSVKIESLIDRVVYDYIGKLSLINRLDEPEEIVIPLQNINSFSNQTYEFIGDTISTLNGKYPKLDISQDLNNKIIIVGSFEDNIINISNEQIPGPYLLAQALSERIWGNTYRPMAPKTTLKITLVSIFLIFIFFALIYKYVKYLQTKPLLIAIFSFITGVLLLIVYRTFISRFANVNLVIPILGMFLAALLAWYYTRKYLVAKIVG